MRNSRNSGEDPEAATEWGPEQFGQLVSDHQRPMFLYALTLLHDPQAAEDVVQDANVVLLSKADQYQPGTDFIRWAYRITYYQVLKHRERKARQERLFSDGFLSLLAADTDCWDEIDVRRDALRFCLGTLSGEDRELVKRRYEPGGTTRSAAEKLARSVQGTRKSLLRIRKKLLECIERVRAREHH